MSEESSLLHEQRGALQGNGSMSSESMNMYGGGAPPHDEVNDDNHGDNDNVEDRDKNGDHADDSEPDAPLDNHLRHNVLYRSAIFATIPVFSAYASMITLQRGIKEKLDITDADKTQSDLFGSAVGSVYLGNLIMRLMHNVVLSFLVPRQRVMLAYVLVALGNMLIVAPYWWFESKSLVWVWVAYITAGLGIGSFESNVMSTLSVLGHETKSWAVIGLPVGFQSVATGFYAIFAIWPDVPVLHAIPYVIIAGLNVLGLLFFTFLLPTKFAGYAAGNDNVVKFKQDLLQWRDWLPRCKFQAIALFCDMTCVSFFSSVVYYIYDLDDIPLWPYASATIPKNGFQVWFNLLAFLGDLTGRRVAYGDPATNPLSRLLKHRNPLWYLLFSLLGGALILSKTALCAPFGMFFVMWANGLTYAASTRHIDDVVDDRYILVALSVWLFVGDVGSYSASQVVQPIQIAFGGVPFTNHTAANATAAIHNATRLH